MKKVKIVLKNEAIGKLTWLVEARLRYLESIKWTTKNDEARVAEMHRLEGIWAELVGMMHQSNEERYGRRTDGRDE